jgi:hypothetical protein
MILTHVVRNFNLIRHSPMSPIFTIVITATMATSGIGVPSGRKNFYFRNTDCKNNAENSKEKASKKPKHVWAIFVVSNSTRNQSAKNKAKKDNHVNIPYLSSSLIKYNPTIRCAISRTIHMETFSHHSEIGSILSVSRPILHSEEISKALK